MKVITNLLKSIAIPKESDFQDIFDDFKTEISGTNPEQARSILNVLKREIELHLYRDYQDYEKGIVEQSLYKPSIKLNDYFKNKYDEKNFTFIIRCDKIITFCTDYFEKESIVGEQIVWKGELKRFGAIFYALIEHGYIETKVGNNGKVNYSSLAKLLINHFKFDKKPKQEYLTRLFNGEDDKFDSDFYAKIKFPKLVE